MHVSAVSVENNAELSEHHGRLLRQCQQAIKGTFPLPVRKNRYVPVGNGSDNCWTDVFSWIFGETRRLQEPQGRRFIRNQQFHSHNAFGVPQVRFIQRKIG